jgi:hypothetical protein
MMRVRDSVFLLALTLGCTCVRVVAQTAIKIVHPAHDVRVPSSLIHTLPAADTRALITLPDRAAVLVYDTLRNKPDSAEFMDNHPHVAVFSPTGVLALDLDALRLAPVGPVRFDSMAAVSVLGRGVLFVCAFTLGVDGAGTFFVFIGQESETYRVLGTLSGVQAQIRLSAKLPDRLEFWTADGQASKDPDQQCVWCSKYYKSKRYEWRNRRLVLLAQSRSTHGYDPERFDSHRFLLK